MAFKLAFRLATALALWGGGTVSSFAFTSPFTFHCTGNACKAVVFLDEGNGCVVVTNHSRRTVHLSMGANLTDDLAPGATFAPLIQVQCYGYYDGGETANFE